MKRWLVVLLLFCSGFTFAGCGNGLEKIGKDREGNTWYLRTESVKKEKMFSDIGIGNVCTAEYVIEYKSPAENGAVKEVSQANIAVDFGEISFVYITQYDKNGKVVDKGSTSNSFNVLVEPEGSFGYNLLKAVKDEL